MDTPAFFTVFQVSSRISFAAFCSSATDDLSAQYASTAFLFSLLGPKQTNHQRDHEKLGKVQLYTRIAGAGKQGLTNPGHAQDGGCDGGGAHFPIRIYVDVLS